MCIEGSKSSKIVIAVVNEAVEFKVVVIFVNQSQMANAATKIWQQ